MAITNTSILIKRSSVTANPGTLKSGELAYSYLSNTMYFGTVGGNGTMNVGGQFYTSQVDAATPANTASTIVKRDSNFSFFGNLYGTANVANTLLNSQNFSISGGDIAATAVGFNGSAGVTLNASLGTVAGLGAGSYGSASAIPVIGISANGRVTSISTVGTTSSLTISDGATSNTINGGVTFYHAGTGGITTTVSANTVTIGTNSSIMRTNTALSGVQTISTDVTIAGNLIVQGTQTYVNTATFVTGDSLIQLAGNNSISDIVDIGFYGMSNVAASNVYHGLIREGSGGTSAGNFYLFKNLPTNPTSNTVAYASLIKASLIADLSLSTGYTVANLGGLGANVATFLATPTSANLLTAVTGNTGTGNLVFATSPTLVTPFLGVANATAYNIGTLTYGVIQAFAAQQANANTYLQAILQNSNTGTQASVDYVVSTAYSSDTNLYGDFGQNGPGFTGAGAFNAANAVYLTATGADLAVGTTSANAIHFVINNAATDSMTIAANGYISTAQAFAVPYGGTGAGTFTANGIMYGNGTNALGATAQAGTSDQTYSNQILTVTNTGLPVWSTSLDGGVF